MVSAWVKLFRSFPLRCNCSLYVFDPDTRLFVFFIFFIIQIGEGLKTYTDLNPAYYFFMNKIKTSVFLINFHTYFPEVYLKPSSVCRESTMKLFLGIVNG